MLKALGSVKFFQEISNIFTTQKTKPVLEEVVSFLLLPLRIIKNAIANIEAEPAIAVAETSTSAIAVEETEEIKNRSANEEAIDIPNWMQYKLLEEMLENKSLFLGQNWQKIEVEQKDIAWFGFLTDDINTWDYNLNRLLKIGFHLEEKMIIVGNNGWKDGGAAIPKIIKTFSEALLAKVKSTLASPIKNGRASTTQLCIGSINEEGKEKGKITIEKKSVSKPKKDGFHCDRRYALNEVSPWVNARLTSVFNRIDDYPQEFNTDRQRMAKGLKSWKYHEKYRLTTIDVEKINYVIECLS